MLFNIHSILFLFVVLTVWTTAIPTPRSHAVTFQPEAREYNDRQLDARRETGQLVRRKDYPELGARTLEGPLVGRRTPLEVRGYSEFDDELDARGVLEEEGQLMSRKIHVPKWMKKIGGFIKNAFNKGKDLVKNAIGGGGGGGDQ
jgi:hypothetical protein